MANHASGETLFAHITQHVAQALALLGACYRMGLQCSPPSKTVGNDGKIRPTTISLEGDQALISVEGMYKSRICTRIPP